ncbi:hypothetical protein L207DRAFT_642860 [Hyaloscypha variabilis F]|uniref:Uncharacterized protein n=1 Tax=Hyaloscypha variabilis (strain UAMH 11265 / GT02V1 / F) TaxID=1149755 RepID=A0A2J6QRB3_HYAVF|nr:hypothetical protein L207DRAFT_642860 [Hyaloscypha variabilis F]
MPRTQRRQERQATLSDVLPSNTWRDPRPEVRIEHLGEGCIVWLPAKDENETGTITCIRDSCCSNRELTKEGYNHPVLVLKIKQDGICSFAQVTSKQRESRNRRDRRIDRLIISHNPPTDLEAALTGALYLEKGRMNRQSYVRTDHIFDIQVAQLRTCSFPLESKPFDTRLRRQSYKYLAQTFDLHEYGSWVPTALLIKACGGYKPPLPQAVPVHQGTSPTAGVRERLAAERNARALVGNRTTPTPQLNAQTPLLSSIISSWQVDRTRRRKEWNGTARRDLEANRRGPPPNNGTGSLLLQLGYLLGFAGIGIIGYLAARALSKGSRSLVRGLTRAHATSSYTGLAGPMVLSATAVIRSVYSEYITTD